MLVIDKPIATPVIQPQQPKLLDRMRSALRAPSANCDLLSQFLLCNAGDRNAGDTFSPCSLAFQKVFSDVRL